MGDYRRGSVKPVPLTVTYWFRVRGFESPISHTTSSARLTDVIVERIFVMNVP